MSEQPLPLSEQDERDLAMLDPDNEAMKRCLLELWNEVLSNVEAIAEQPIPVQVAAKIVATWPQMTWQDTAIYHQRYHQMLLELREILREAIRQHPGCTDHVGPDDATENHDIYKDVLVAWHLALDTYEADWRAEHPESHIQAAVIADARAFFFAQTGLAGHLDSIGFSLTDGEFLAAVEAVKEETGE